MPTTKCWQAEYFKTMIADARTEQHREALREALRVHRLNCETCRQLEAAKVEQTR